jgi:hypothetical protein
MLAGIDLYGTRRVGWEHIGPGQQYVAVHDWNVGFSLAECFLTCRGSARW